MLLRRNFHIFFPTVFLKSVKYRCKLKPWSNGLASSRKLKTWVYLRIRLARPCVHLRPLAMTCDHFGRDQICPQVNASFLPFGHPTQVNASSVTEPVALKWLFFLRLSCTCEETCQSVWPSNASLFPSSTCRYLRLLASPFDQGLREINMNRVRLNFFCLDITLKKSQKLVRHCFVRKPRVRCILQQRFVL